MTPPFRNPSSWEIAVLEMAASKAPISGYLEQVAVCEVREYDDDGDLEICVFDPSAAVKVDVSKVGYYLTELIYLDVDGEAVSLMLHGREGYLGFLEWHKAAGPIQNRQPDIRCVRAVSEVPADWKAKLPQRFPRL